MLYLGAGWWTPQRAKEQRVKKKIIPQPPECWAYMWTTAHAWPTYVGFGDLSHLPNFNPSCMPSDKVLPSFSLIRVALEGHCDGSVVYHFRWSDLHLSEFPCSSGPGSGLVMTDLCARFGRQKWSAAILLCSVVELNRCRGHRVVPRLSPTLMAQGSCCTYRSSSSRARHMELRGKWWSLSHRSPKLLRLKVVEADVCY